MNPLDPLSIAPAAFLAGILMFLAPCTLPIIPGYLAFIAGVPKEGNKTNLQQKNARRRTFSNAVAFVIGFSFIFILLGTFAGFIGMILGPWRYVLARGAGLLIILFGLTMLGVVHLPVLSSERRMRLPHFIVVGRWESSLLIGALFALGWSPCIGPILGTVLLFAGTSATALQGAFLLAIFSLGLALPFLLTALLIGKVGEVFSHFNKTIITLSHISGTVLILFGVLIVLGDMGLFVSWGYQLFSFLGYDRLLNYL